MSLSWDDSLFTLTWRKLIVLGQARGNIIIIDPEREKCSGYTQVLTRIRSEFVPLVDVA